MTSDPAFAPMQIPVLETGRLRLRANRPEDFEPYAGFCASDRSGGRGGPLSREDAWMVFAAEIGHWQLRGYGFWAVEERESETYCGQVGLWNPEGWPEPEVGWMLVGTAERRGIALEAALAARSHAYDTLGWARVVSCIRADNARSIALANRMGARLDRRVARADRPDLLVYLHPAREAA